MHPRVKRSTFPRAKGTANADVLGSHRVTARSPWEDSSDRLFSNSLTALCSEDYVPHLTFVRLASVLVVVFCTSRG